MRKLIFLFITLTTIALNAYADEVSFVASGPDVVVAGERFRISYKFNTQKVKDFRAPSMKGFEVLMGPSRSTYSNTQIVNGSMQSESGVTFTYVLLASEPGDYNIPGATATANGNQAISNALKIKVLPPDTPAGSVSSSSTGQSGNASSSNNQSVSNQEVFVTANVTKTKVYEQEAFMLTYKIYSLESRMTLENVRLPDFKGFHQQEIERPTHATWTQEHYKGRNYFTIVYRQFVLFPQQSGELTIDPARFDVAIEKVVRSADPFDAFFNGGSNVVAVKKAVSTPAIKIDVLPLPSGKPADFSGAVGDFSISSTINTQELKTNDAITLKLIISGTGNMKLIGNPDVKFPESFEVYEPKVDNQMRLTSTGLTGNKVVEYLAIPRHAGDYTIPPVSFSYFDLKSKSYKTLTTQAYPVQVEKGAGNADNVVANFTNKEDLKILGEDIRFIKLNNVELLPRNEFFFGSWIYWLCYIVPFLAFALFFIFHYKQAKENANVAKVRTKKANKVAVKRMKVAGKLLAENKKELFYDEVLKALWGYVSDKLNIPVARLSKSNVEDKLHKRGVNDELIKEFIDALNECEFARYAPGDENKAMDNVYATSLNVITKMENSIK